MLGELKDLGLARVAMALYRAAGHVESFFKVLKEELAFYMGCVNLYRELQSLGEPLVFPVPLPPGEQRFSTTGLYDASLALTMKGRVKGNRVNANGKRLVIITGPNRGGKTTFLRSVGLAQLMMQNGIFVPAESFTGDIATGIFTHFRREEDREMQRGKFNGELERMSGIVDHLKPNALVLLNESFSATNDREGSELARQIIGALVERDVRVFYVTHLYEFARDSFNRDRERVLYLRAERLPNGERTYRLIEGEPLKTSHGEDLYNKIFGEESG